MYEINPRDDNFVDLTIDGDEGLSLDEKYIV